MELISQLAFDLAPSLPEAQVQPLRGQVVDRVAEPLKPRETGTALVDFSALLVDLPSPTQNVQRGHRAL